MKSWVAGLAVRVITSIAIAGVAAKSALTILPAWAFPIANALLWPVGWVWYQIYPTWDTNPPFIPYDSFWAFVALMIFAIPVYTALLYLPNLVKWLARITRVALQLPSEFLVYFVAGGLLGGMFGIGRWTVSQHVMSRPALYVFAGLCGLAVGWGMGVGRSYLGLRHREPRAAA